MAVGVLLLTYSYAYRSGSAHTRSVFELKLEEIRSSSARLLAATEKRARDTERAAMDSILRQSAKHVEEQRNAQVEINRLDADLRASRVRLSIPVASCAAPSPSGTDPTVAGGSGAEARAELMPETAASLVDIAADGDAAVRQLNALIDAYNDLRGRINAEGG